MNRQKRFAVIDTETLGGVKDEYCNAYHIGAVAMTRTDLIDKINIIVLENLKMDTAFYGKMKREYYRSLLKDDSVIICYTEAEAKEIFSRWLESREIDCVCAYNSQFDFEKTLVRNCIEDLEFFDIYYAFFQTIARTRKYNKFCKENDYVSAKNNLKMTAEIVYRFLTNDNSFIEEHTALSDSEIEAEILKAVWNTHKKFTKNEHKNSKENFYKQIKAK